MIFIDDFLTRRWWDTEPYPRGLGVNIPLDYKEMTIKDELATLVKIKEMGIEFKLFVIGYVLEMSLCNPEIENALFWCRDNRIELCGHGYYHTKKEYELEYVRYAEKTYWLMHLYQNPPYLWRYPREEVINTEYIERFFTVVKPDAYLDEELLVLKTLDVLKGHEHHNVVSHSFYLTRPIRKFTP